MTNPSYIDYSKNDVFAAGMVAHYMLMSVTNTFSTHHPNYSEATYIEPPEGCPAPIAELVWRMVNPNPAQRLTAIEALAEVDALIDDSSLHWA